jgi:hypothetical protein
LRELIKSYSVKRNKPQNYMEGDYANCIMEFSYSTFNAGINYYRNCLVTPEGVIYKNIAQLVKDSVVGPKLFNNYTTRRYLREIYRFEKKYLSRKEKYLVGFDAWSIGHYHWITEVLPRLNLVREEISDFILILPDIEYVRNIGISMLGLVGLKPKDIVFIRPRHLFYIPHLYFINHVACSGYINDILLQNVKKEIDRNIFIKNNFTPNKKIYISRKKADKRKVLNEKETEELFISKGYETVTFEGLSLEEQVYICNNAETIASIHGAGLTNMIFMRTGSQVLEFRRSEKFVNQCYWHMADALHHKYYYFYGVPDTDKPIEGDGCNLTIPITKLETLLNIMESRKSDPTSY